MVTGISHMYVWVEDQDRALSFYTEKLGFEVRDDMSIGSVRWITVGHPDQPQLRVALSAIGSLDAGSAASIRDLQAKGSINGGGLTADDCRATYQELAARGVPFVQDPQARPYGIEAIFRDDSGNLWGLVQPAGH